MPSLWKKKIFRLWSDVLPVQTSKVKARTEFFNSNICCRDFNSELNGEKKFMYLLQESTFWYKKGPKKGSKWPEVQPVVAFISWLTPFKGYQTKAEDIPRVLRIKPRSTGRFIFPRIFFSKYDVIMTKYCFSYLTGRLFSGWPRFSSQKSWNFVSSRLVPLTGRKSQYKGYFRFHFRSILTPFCAK